MRTTHLVWCCVSMGMCMPGWLQANPIGGVVVPGSGKARIGQSLPNTLTIQQTTPRVIINWRNFSIAPGEVTRFVQPNANAAALNRVVTDNPSLIFGSLQANGQVYLINPNGILFGRSAQVNVNGMVASTLDLGPDERSANARFLSGGDFTFQGSSPAAIRNEGSIAGRGDIFLIARQVENAGSISGGQVGLAAGAQVELRQSGRERIGVITGEGSVDNAGAIRAVTAELKAHGGNIYSLAVNNSGVVRADSMVEEGGSIFLRASGGGTVQNSGTLDASSASAGGKGGDVQVSGGRVLLTDAARVDVSGDAGGGRVLIGGDFQGKNPRFPNAQQTFIGQDVSIHADARVRGDGGTVVVWADDYTRFEGSISARGGARGGNGGLIETSGKRFLDLGPDISVNASARAGRNGTWLLDPTDITIIPTAGDLDAGPPYVPTAAANTIGADDIVAVLDTGTDVTISTASAQAGEGNILVNAAIAKTAGGDALLRLTADNNITVNAPISSSAGMLNMEFTAGNALTLNDSLNANGGSVLFEHAGPLTGVGLITAGQLRLQGGGSVGTLANRLNTEVDSLVMGKTGGNSFIAEATDTSLRGNTGGGNLDLSGVGVTIDAPLVAGEVNLDLSGPLTDSGAGQISATTLTLSSASDVGSLANRLNTEVDNLVLNMSGGHTFIAEASDVNLQGSTGGGDIDLTAVGLTINGPLDAGNVRLEHSGALADTGAGQINATTLTLFGGGDVGSLANRLNIDVANLVFDKSGGNSFITEATDANLRGNTSGGIIDLTAAGLTIDAPLFAGPVRLDHSGTLTDSGGGQINAPTLTLLGGGSVGTLANRLNTAVDTIVFNKSGGDSFIQELDAVNLQGVTGGGALDLIGGALSLSGNLSAGAGKLTLAGTTIGLGAFGLNGGEVWLSHSGPLSGSGLITAGRLVLFENGDVGTPLNPLQTDVGTIHFGKGGGDSFINEANDVNLRGTTTGGGIDLTAAGITIDDHLTAGNVLLIHSGNLNDAPGVRLNGTTLTLAGGGNVGSAANRLDTSVDNLRLAKSGGNSFIHEADAVNLEGLTGGGNLDLIGGALSLSGNLSSGAGNVALTGTTIGLGAFSLNGAEVRLSHSQALSGSGLITAGRLLLLDDGQVGTALNRLNTDVGSILFGKGGGNSFINEANDVNVEGVTTGSDIDLIARAVTLSGALDAGAGSVIINHSGTLGGAGRLTANRLTLRGAGQVGDSAAQRLATTVNTIEFAKSGGNSFIHELDAVNVQGVTGGGSLDLVGGALSLSGNLSAGAANLALSGTTIGLGTFSLNGGEVRLSHSGLLSGSGLITAGRLVLLDNGTVGTALNRLNTDVGSILFGKSGGNSFIIEANDVNLEGATTGGDIDLVAGTITLSSALDAGAGSVTFDHTGTLGGAGRLTANRLTLRGAGQVGDSAQRLATAVNTIDFAKSGGNSFIYELDAVGLQGFTGGGHLDLIGVGGPLSLSGNLNAGAGNVALTGTAMDLGAFSLSGAEVRLSHSQALSGSGLITAGRLVLLDVGQVGTALTRLNTDVGSILFGKSGGNSFINEANDVNVEGATTGGDIDLAARAITLSDALDAGAGSVAFDHTGILGGAGRLTANRLTLRGAGQVGDSAAQRLVTAVNTIEFAKSGGNSFIQELDAVNLQGLSGGGHLDLIGGALSLSGNLSAGAGNVVLSGTTLGLGTFSLSGAEVRLSHSQALTGSGLITAGRLVLLDGGQVGAAFNRLNTDVGSILFGKSGGNSFINEANDVDLEGATTGGNIDLAARAITLNGALDAGAGSVTFDHTGTLGGAGRLTANRLTLRGAGQVGDSAAQRLATAVNTIDFAKSGGNSFVYELDAVNLQGFTGGGHLDLIGVGGPLSLSGNLNAGAGDVALTGTAIDLGAFSLSGAEVRLSHSQALTGSGLITAGRLVLLDGGQVGAAFNRLNTDVGSILFGKGGGNSFISEANDVNVEGVTTGGDIDLVARAIALSGALDAGPGSITFDHTGTLGGAGRLTANRLTLRGAGQVGDSAAQRLATAVNTIDLAKSGGNSFLHELDAVNLQGFSGGGNLDLIGGALSLSGNLNAGAGNLALAGSTIGLGGFSLNGAEVRLSHSGLLSGSGFITAARLLLLGDGQAGSLAQRLNTDVGTIQFAKGGGSSFINEANHVNLQGATPGDIDLLGTDITIDDHLHAANVTLNHSGTLSDAPGVRLNATTLTLAGAGDVGGAANRLDVSVDNLVFAKSSGHSFIQELDAVNFEGVTGGGNLDLIGGALTLSGNLNAGPGSLVLAGTTIGLGTFDVNAGEVRLSHGLALSGSGSITAGRLVLLGDGQAGSLAQRLNTDVGTIQFAKGGGNSFISEANAVNLEGTTAGGDINLSANGPLTLSDEVNAGAGTVTLDGTSIRLGAFDLSGGQISLRHSDDLTDTGGRIISPGTLTLSGSGTVGVNTADRLNTEVAAIHFDKSGGDSFIADVDNVDVSGDTAGRIDLTAARIGHNGVMNAGSVRFAGSFIELAGVLNAGEIDLTAPGMSLQGDLNAGSGDVTLRNASVNLAGDTTISGNDFFYDTSSINGNQNDLTLELTGSATLKSGQIDNIGRLTTLGPGTITLVANSGSPADLSGFNNFDAAAALDLQNSRINITDNLHLKANSVSIGADNLHPVGASAQLSVPEVTEFTNPNTVVNEGLRLLFGGVDLAREVPGRSVLYVVPQIKVGAGTTKVRSGITRPVSDEGGRIVTRWFDVPEE